GVVQKLLAPREAANILGISYPTLKQWIYHGKIKSVKTPGGHHRVPESEIDRLFPKKLSHGDIETRRGNFRKISRRNQFTGRVIGAVRQAHGNQSECYFRLQRKLFLANPEWSALRSVFFGGH